jgi:hypothetical protein
MINFYSCSKNWFSFKEFFFHYHVMLRRCLCSFLELLDVLELRRPSRRRQKMFYNRLHFRLCLSERNTRGNEEDLCVASRLWKCIKADKTSNEPICLPPHSIKPIKRARFLRSMRNDSREIESSITRTFLMILEFLFFLVFAFLCALLVLHF